jgi:hypothetical protein
MKVGILTMSSDHRSLIQISVPEKPDMISEATGKIVCIKGKPQLDEDGFSFMDLKPADFRVAK